MVKLSGILEYSMGGFLCLRGFANFKELSRISKENPDVQRKLIEDHKGEMAAFLNKGEYKFFPEIVLSTSLETNKNFDEVSVFFTAILRNEKWSKKLGQFNISVFYHETGDKNKIAHIAFDETKIKLNRVDGNHRLSAADEVTEDFRVPFCLVLCQTDAEEKQYSTAIFHNINAKQIPLKLEENLRVILKHSEVFSDSLIKTDPSFGWKYYLARKTIESIDFSYFPEISKYIDTEKCSFFVDLYGFLIENGSLSEDDNAVDKLKSQLTEIETALVESRISATTTNIAVIGALAYYKLTNPSKYRGFLSWIKKNNVGKVEELHIEDVINLYDEIYEHVPKKIFLARWYPSAENDGADETARAESRVKAIKEVAKELGLAITDLGTRDTGTFDIRKVMYDDIKDCDIFIADLSGARHNVMIEVGYALKHVGTGRMAFYFQEGDNCKSVPFDVSHLAYDKIVDSSEIKTKTKARIQTILQQSRNGEI
ncbi:MAG: hypothetical protein MJ168_07730 [Clostridia bacterium]|nr:hypothetical protein [Clostridia bacterium]